MAPLSTDRAQASSQTLPQTPVPGPAYGVVSDATLSVLQRIADGRIVLSSGDPQIAPGEIAAAAAEALSICEVATVRVRLVATCRQQHSRAWEPWDANEDERLERLHGRRHSEAEISEMMARSPNAVHRRLEVLGLIPAKPRKTRRSAPRPGSYEEWCEDVGLDPDTFEDRNGVEPSAGANRLILGGRTGAASILR